MKREAAAAVKAAREDACLERVLDRFPWPNIPPPTNRRVIVKDLLKYSGPATPASQAWSFPYPEGPRTLGELLIQLRSRLAHAGYPMPPVLGAGCNGFALILEGERIREDGTRIGFEQWNQGRQLGLIDILAQLMKGEPGFFRMIVLVASSQKPVEGGPPITAEELRRLLMLGASGLPRGMENVAFDDRYELYALVYEFETSAQKVAAQIGPAGRVSVLGHLRAIGLTTGQ